MLGDTSFRCIITFMQDGSVEKMFIIRAIKKGDANHVLRVLTVLLPPFAIRSHIVRAETQA